MSEPKDYNIDSIFEPLIDNPSLTLTTTYWNEAKAQLFELITKEIPEKISSTGALQEHELIAMIDLNKESLIPREKGTLIFNETELHQLVVKLIAEYQNKTVDEMHRQISDLFNIKETN